jgi:hypothetical protein
MQAVFGPARNFFRRAAPRARRIFPLTAPVESGDVRLSLAEWAFVACGTRAPRRRD